MTAHHGLHLSLSLYHARTVTSGLLISISGADTLNSLEHNLVLLEEARKMTYMTRVNVIYTLGLTIIMNATSLHTAVGYSPRSMNASL